MTPPSGSGDAGRCTATNSGTRSHPSGWLDPASVMLLLVLLAAPGRASAEPAAADGLMAARTAAVALGGNLLANPGAEDGAREESGLDVVADIPGWVRAGDVTVVAYAAKPGRWPTADDPGPVDRGLACFTGGPQVQVDSLGQVVDLTSIGGITDAGAAKFDLAAYLGGSSSSEDNVAVRVRFLDAAGALLDTAAIGPVSADERGGQTALLLRTASGAVPPATRAVAVTMVFVGTSGQNCWALADSVGLSLSCTAAADVPWPAGPAGLQLAVAPEPAVTEARVSFALPAAGPARLEVLDVTGRRVALLADGPRPAGRYELRWSPRRAGAGAGVYFIRLATPSGTLARKLVALAR
jgi:hypothetical protein